jgi:hypothetical protein
MKLTPEQKAANLQERRKTREALKELAQYSAEASQKPVKSIKITIDWKRSYMWGNNPHLSATIEHHDGGYSYANATAGGCGYDKESTVIADIFNQFLKYKLWSKPYEELRQGDKGNKYNGGGDKENSAPYGISSGRYETRLNNIVEHRGFSGGIGTSCYYAISQFIGGTFKKIASGKKFDVYQYEDTPCETLPREADPFGSLKMVCAIGKLLCDTPEEKNNWNKRMLSTQPGIDIPEDFDKLPEEEKTRRLEGALNQL